MGNVIQVVDADNNQTTYAFDGDNREIGMTDALGKQATRAYDKASRLTSSTDRDGQRINYSYDAGNREIGAAWLSSTGTTVNLLTFTYDQDNDQLTAANYAGTYTYTYDKLDRVATEKEPFGVTLTMGYDASGNQTSVQDSFGGLTTSVYNGDNLLQTRELGGTGVTVLRTDFSYTARNQVASQTNSSNLAGTTIVGAISYTYDPQGRMTLETYNTGGSTVDTYTYTYDLADRLSSQQIDGTLATFGYDNANQLTYDGTTGATYSYDPTGNRKNTGYVTGTNNELLNDGTFTYSYDANGQTVAKKQTSNNALWSYTYDNHGEMLTATETSSTGLLLAACTYTYDVYGNRLSSAETQGGTTTTTHYAYDAQGNAWADLSSSNALQTHRVYGDQPDQVLARDTSTTVAYYIADREGSVRAIANGAGAVQDRLTYDAFGDVLTQSTPADGDKYEAFGYRFDAVTGLAWDGARNYDGPDGRFETQDPLGFGGGQANLYVNVSNDPTNYTDPSGLEEQPKPVVTQVALSKYRQNVIDIAPAKAQGAADEDIIKKADAQMPRAGNQNKVRLSIESFKPFDKVGLLGLSVNDKDEWRAFAADAFQITVPGNFNGTVVQKVIVEVEAFDGAGKSVGSLSYHVLEGFKIENGKAPAIDLQMQATNVPVGGKTVITVTRTLGVGTYNGAEAKQVHEFYIQKGAGKDIPDDEVKKVKWDKSNLLTKTYKVIADAKGVNPE